MNDRRPTTVFGHNDLTMHRCYSCRMIWASNVFRQTKWITKVCPLCIPIRAKTTWEIRAA